MDNSSESIGVDSGAGDSGSDVATSKASAMVSGSSGSTVSSALAAFMRSNSEVQTSTCWSSGLSAMICDSSYSPSIMWLSWVLP